MSLQRNCSTVAGTVAVLQLSDLPDTKSGNPVTGQRVFISNPAYWIPNPAYWIPNPAYWIPNPAYRIGKIQNFALTVRKIQLIGFQKRQTRFPRNVSNSQFLSSNYKNSNPTHFEALQQARTKSIRDILGLQLVNTQIIESFFVLHL